MKHSPMLFLVAASCALGATACSDGDTTGDEPVGQVSAAVDQDTTPPTFTCASPGDCFLTSTVDATAGPGQITAKIHITDAPAGLHYATVYLKSPSGAHQKNIGVSGTPVSGTIQDGIFQGTTTIPQYSEAGTWSVEGFTLSDTASNQAHPSVADLAQAGFPLSFTVQSNTDLTPPDLTCAQPGECTLTSSVDVTAGPAPVTARIRLADATAGVHWAQMSLRSPSGAQSRAISFTGGLVSGTIHNGVFQGSQTIPKFSEAGTWYVEAVVFADWAGNKTTLEPAALPPGFPKTFTVLSNPDTTPPTFQCAQPGDWTFSSPIDTSAGPAAVAGQIRLLDAQSGVQWATVVFESPSGSITSQLPLNGAPVSGTIHDGIFAGTMNLSQFSQLGSWSIRELVVADKVGNQVWYSLADIQAAGCLASLTNCHAGSTCNDTNACTTGETCSASGQCGGGALVGCDDGNACTADSCNPASGCVHTPISCDDGNPCTADLCSPAIGCLHNPTSGACDDGNPCTANDACLAGYCWGPPASCDDGNPCTADTCAPATGCGHAPAPGACEDGNPCTSNDQFRGPVPARPADRLR